MIKVILFILGIFLCSFGLLFDLLYLNLLSMGYSFLEYVKFIISRVECNSLLAGVIILFFLLGGKNIYEKILRFKRKF